MTKRIHSAVGDYYNAKLEMFGPTPKGVDWKNLDSQLLRFEQLHQWFKDDTDGSVADLGCGYGEFLGYLRARGHQGAYCGVDVSPAMTEAAEARYADMPDARFLIGSVPPTRMDFVVSSGIFNVCLDFSTKDWERHIRDTLGAMNEAGCRGIAFNCLTSYADPEYMRGDLYYGDPCYWFDFCKRNLGRKVSLLHDYELYEFTIIVKK